MADKQVTVAVPEERVPEFYLWFAHFLAAQDGDPRRGGGGRGSRAGGPGSGLPWRGSPGGGEPWGDTPGGDEPWAGGPGGGRGGGARGRGRGPGSRMHPEAEAWSAQDAEQAAWLYGKLAPPARELLDLLVDAPGQRFSGNDIAARLRLDKGAHGVAGILAWPGRYSRKLGRELPISTEGRDDGGTDYYLDPEIATLFAAARGPRTT
jgi:hypothetical protein